MRRHAARWAGASLSCLALATLSLPTMAMSFGQAYEAARGFDSRFQAAGFERQTAQEGVPVARAALRPTISANLSDTQVTGVRIFPNAISQEVRVRADYSAPQASLSMRAPIINWEATSNLRRAELLAMGADSILLLRGLELVDRLGGAYLDLLLAQENLSLAERQVLAFEAQKTRAERRLQRGEGTRTEIAQAQAAFEQARSKVVEAADQVTSTRQALRRVTGQDAPSVNNVAGEFEPPPLAPASAEEWLALALRQNPLIQARQQSVDAAKFAVQGRRAGHYPRLDVVASISQVQNESLSSLNQTSRLTSIGFQLTVPLYNGGGVDAAVRQAAADLARLEEEARTDREGVELDVQRSHRTVFSGPSRIGAQRMALAASELALEGISKALDAGLATPVDVLDAQSRVYAAARDLAQARYDYLQARLRLLAQAGMPAADIVQDIDRLLTVAAPIKERTAP